MAPKKRDKDSDASKTPRIDHIQADHELFLQAFESMYYLLKKYIISHTQRFSFNLFLFQSQLKSTGIYALEICAR